jgi:hypothetical protein
MHDLVVLDNATVGVVVNVEQDALRVLTNQASRHSTVQCSRVVGLHGCVGTWQGGSSTAVYRVADKTCRFPLLFACRGGPTSLTSACAACPTSSAR